MLAPVSSLIPRPAFQHFLPFSLPPRVLAPDPGGPEETPRAPRIDSLERGFGALVEFCKPEVVDRVLAECGCLEKRRRRFPARLVVYVTLLMCLFGTLSYQKLMYQVAKAAPRSGAWPVPNKSSFCRARAKLGWQVMEGLFRALARPLADERASDSFWRGLRVMAIDGTTIALAETPANAAFFGGQTNQDGMRMGPPQLKTVQLLECGTHAIVDAEAGSYRG